MNSTYFFFGVTLTAVTLFVSCTTKEYEHDPQSSHSQKVEPAVHEGEHDLEGEQIRLSETQINVGGVEVETVQPTTFSEILEVTGRILPSQGNEASVAATMAGIVSFTSNPLSEGTAVQAGQNLFTISAAGMADGNPNAAALAELEAARSDLERVERLASEKLVTKKDLEEARRRFSTAQSAASSLGDNTRSRMVGSPIKGFIKSLLVKPGEFVEAGQTLAIVTQSNRLQLRAEVPERYYEKLPSITSAHFRMAYDSPETIHCLDSLGGRLVAVGKAATPDGFFIPVTFEFKNIGNFLPGSFVQVYLLGQKRSGILAVPVEAIDEMEGLYFVYIQERPGEFERREVKLGASDGERVEIVSGLKVGEHLVVKGTRVVRMAGTSSIVPEGHSH